MELSKERFKQIEADLRERGFDKELRDTKTCLMNRKQFSPDEFAEKSIFVVLASGFKNTTAAKKHPELMCVLQKNKRCSEEDKPILRDKLLSIFRHEGKINAIIDIWYKRDIYCNGYYLLNEELLQEKLLFLQKMPYIGKITVNHIARNLGEDVSKYDIWIQRLGVAYSQDEELEKYIKNSGRINEHIKNACNKMFEFLKKETGLQIGYIDLVLWRACEKNLISEMSKYYHKQIDKTKYNSYHKGYCHNQH